MNVCSIFQFCLVTYFVIVDYCCGFLCYCWFCFGWSVDRSLKMHFMSHWNICAVLSIEDYFNVYENNMYSRNVWHCANINIYHWYGIKVNFTHTLSTLVKLCNFNMVLALTNGYFPNWKYPNTFNHCYTEWQFRFCRFEEKKKIWSIGIRVKWYRKKHTQHQQTTRFLLRSLWSLLIVYDSRFLAMVFIFNIYRALSP